MNARNTTMFKRVFFAVLASAFTFSCAQDVGKIDRTQNNILAKKDLEGEWYFRQTTVETPYSSAFTFEGDTSKLERGTFEIQEDSLYFFRTYEFQNNTEQPGNKGDSDKPYLAWLEGDTREYTPNPYQNRDLKFAIGTPEKDAGGADVSCGSKKAMHDFCQTELKNGFLYCGHAAATLPADRKVANAICVRPTRFVYRGAPVAVFPIQSQFDIIWEYNPATGEKTNVLVENASDRFWYEREYIRVNWSNTQVTNFSGSLSGMLQDVVMMVYEGDTGPEDERFRMFRTEGSREPYYFDYISKYVFSAPSEYLDYYGMDIPLCFFYPWYSGGIFECTSEQIKARTAFMKVPQNDTYKPWDYNDHLLGKFGYFRSERANFDDRYDVTYGGLSNYINRFDLWAEHVYKADGTEDYTLMEPKPIVYYLSENFPRAYVQEAKDIAKEWAKPFDQVVAFYKGAAPDKGMFILCENNNAEAQAAVTADLPVAETDTKYCQDMNTVKMAGDLRYSFLVGIERPCGGGLLGYGPPSPDPLTGKIVSGNAHIYISAMTKQSNYAADLVEYVVGAKDYSTTAEGLDKVVEFYAPMISIGSNPPPANVEEAKTMVRGAIKPGDRARLLAKGLDKEDSNWVSMRMNMVSQNKELEASMIQPDLRALFRDPSLASGAALTETQVDKYALSKWANHLGVKKARDRFRAYAENFMTREEFVDGALVHLVKKWEARYNDAACSGVAKAIQDGTDLAFNMAEFNLVKGACNEKEEGSRRTREDYPILSNVKPYNPATAMAGDTCTRIEQGGVAGYYWVNTCTVEKLSLQFGAGMLEIQQASVYTYWPPSSWYVSVKEPRLAATQKFMRDLFDTLRAEMIDDFQSREFVSLSLHEMGHTLGLRHNFEGSADPLNFPRAYWDLKMPAAEDGSLLPLDILAPEKDFQKEQGMRELQYSSIMDYGAKFNSLWNGLGLYDYAAIKFGYGGVLEVFSQKPDLSKWTAYLDEPENAGEPWDVAPVRQDENKLVALFKTIHYTKAPEVFGGLDKLYDRADVAWTSVVGAKCTADTDCAATPGCEGCTECRAQLGGSFCSPPEKVEVPYRFCSDEYTGMTPTCDVWDEGVDPYEITRNSIDDYWWYWLFWGHWRQNLLWHYENYNGAIQWTFNRIQQQFKWWAVNYIRYNNNDYWQKKFGMPWEEDPNGGLVGSVASLEGFNALMSVFAIPDGMYPDVRYYGYNIKNQRYETVTDYNRQDLGKYFVLEENAGRFGARPMYPAYQFWGELMIPVTAGAIYDRLNAFVALCDPWTEFMNIDEFPDHRRYLINYYSFFPDRMIRLLGGLTTHRAENYAPCVVEDDNGNPVRLKLRNWQNIEDEAFCNDGHYLEPEPVDYDFPTTWYRIPMLAAYYGMSLMINNYDKRFIDTTKIFLKGHEDAIDVPADVEKVEFADPLTGKIYVAYKTGDKQTFDTAFYLVSEAARLFGEFTSVEDLQDSYKNGEGKLQRMVGLLELLRGMHAAYDYTSIPL